MNLTDHQKLPSVPVHRADSVFRFFEGAGAPQYSRISAWLDSNLQQSQTAAFLVVRHDSIIYEKYFNGFDPQSLLPSNSMAKSFTGSLVSIAHEEGKIRSLSDPITYYIPELKPRDPAFEKITIQHLLDMRSGLDFNEGSYDLKDDAIRYGLTRNLEKQLLKAKIAQEPGRFRYQSINTQLLGLIIERATGKKLPDYLEEKIWKPMGAEHDATWNVDSKKHQLAISSAGINAVARDFARFGRLYLNGGRAGAKQVVDEAWVQAVASEDTMQRWGGYKNHWWSRMPFRSFEDSATAMAFRDQTAFSVPVRRVGNSYRVGYRTGAFNASGFLNQIIYVNPDKDLVIVRLGKRFRNANLFFTQFIYNLGQEL
jgi:CubicO group peptidase (beta-lactamase class C family)